MRSYSLQDGYKQPIDLKLNALFEGKTRGFFIELGANDGLNQSNTALLEFYKDWTGLLIEPSPNAYEQCKVNRPKSIVLNYACVSNTYTDSHVSGDFQGHLMSSVNGQRRNSGSRQQVPARTLESLLDIYNPSTPIDLLSLDTEGYELPILQGLNLNKYRPHYMLIEVYTKDYEAICAFLKDHGYALHSNFSNYTKEIHPSRDGTHNDYLFVDTTRA